MVGGREEGGSPRSETTCHSPPLPHVQLVHLGGYVHVLPPLRKQLPLLPDYPLLCRCLHTAQGNTQQLGGAWVLRLWVPGGARVRNWANRNGTASACKRGPCSSEALLLEGYGNICCSECMHLCPANFQAKSSAQAEGCRAEKHRQALHPAAQYAIPTTPSDLHLGSWPSASYLLLHIY